MSEQIDIRTEIIQFLNSDPFQPFQIVMVSGDRYEVADPHAAAVGQATIIVLPPRGAGHSVLRMNQISSLETLESAAS